MINKSRKIRWEGDSLDNLRKFPTKVKDEIGHSLYLVQLGEKPRNTKLLKGFGGMVTEIISDFNTNTFRAIYTVKLGDDIYVLHCFQKKSKKGIKTPPKDIKLIKQRLLNAKKYYLTENQGRS
jgi:phage-related protein